MEGVSPGETMPWARALRSITIGLSADWTALWSLRFSRCSWCSFALAAVVAV